MDYGRICRDNKNHNINEEADAIRFLTKEPISNSELLVLVEHKIKKGQDFIVKLFRNRISGETLEDSIARIEDALLEQRKRKEEEIKENELKIQKEKKKREAEEEQKMIDVKQEQQRL